MCHKGKRDSDNNKREADRERDGEIIPEPAASGRVPNTNRKNRIEKKFRWMVRTEGRVHVNWGRRQT